MYNFGACWFREILAAMGNQEDLESMAHRDLRWGDRNQKCVTSIRPKFQMPEYLCCDRVNEDLPETTATRESVAMMWVSHHNSDGST